MSVSDAFPSDVTSIYSSIDDLEKSGEYCPNRVDKIRQREVTDAGTTVPLYPHLFPLSILRLTYQLFFKRRLWPISDSS